MNIDRQQLIQRVQEIEGLSDDERAGLLQLLREQKKYGIVWEEKPEEAELRLATELPVLIEDTERRIISENPDAPNHILIEGDNLHALTALSYTHEGKIDVIYIDPPYNTGNKDFVYNDSYVDREDGYRHSKWLSFINKRLKIAKQLLSDRGVIFISIDDNEVAQLKMLCDEVFGADNFQSIFHVQVRYAEKSLNEEKAFKPLMEYVLIYSTSQFVPKRELEEYGTEKFCYEITEVTEGTRFSVNGQDVIVFKPNEWSIKKVPGFLKGLKETWVTGSIYTTMSYGKVFQNVVEPRISIDGYGCLYKVLGRGDDGLGYRYYTGPAKKTAQKGKMYSGMPLDKQEAFKTGNAPYRELPILTCYDYAADFGNIRTEGGVAFNSGKKPIKMLSNLIGFHENKNCVILDFFAGSGSTLHAVCYLNSIDQGTRQCILITNNENNICSNITYPRCSNVINGYGNVSGLTDNTLRYYRTDFVPNETTIRNKRRLMELSTDMLCIKNNLYCEQDEFAGRRLNKQKMRYFTAQPIINSQLSIINYTSMLVVYDEQVVDALVDTLVGMDVKRKIMIYVFSNTSYPHTDNFEEVLGKVELCALPSAILNAYKKICRT